MRRAIRRVTDKALAIGDSVLRSTNPVYRAKRKYASELNFWKWKLKHLQRWYEAEDHWYGIPPPSAVQKMQVSDIWAVNAVMAMHQMRPSYLEELQLDGDFFHDQRILEVGCGPLAPSLQFSNCIRHGLDPLIDRYLQVGWPLYDYDVTFVNAKGESMPYVDSYFDAVISVNALDHVDDFMKVASEIQRVVKVGGGIFFEMEYHAPTVHEPQRLNDSIILRSFSSCNLRKVCERGKRELFQVLANRFGLLPQSFDDFTNKERFVTWHGQRIA
jgi:ubiquinone/menaquinone biosynthesis C-methylase UbiE